MLRIRLVELLEQRNRTVYWLAKETKIKNTALYRLKNGQALGLSFDYLLRICNALECQPGDLLVIADEKTRKQSGSKKRKG